MECTERDFPDKRKQQELGDQMDLSSYLLRPIQRISKYSLLLQDMLALASSYRPKDVIQDTLFTSSVCAQSVRGPAAYVPDLSSSERERERVEIQAAADLTGFQMHHGNDLLTMDAIQDCDTSDIGMTHNSTVSGLCFEIWFRRRKSEDTYTLRASSVEVKKAWITDLETILWDQAAHSRELRMQERVFMGMNCKPFMDIQPSDAAICDRAISCVLPGRSKHSSFVSQSSKAHPPICRTPSLRRNGSPAVNRKKPGVAPKPPHLATAQTQVKVK
ncbi:pleckstrin homology domain-containing family G member 4B-like [Embiotoca jacksoni]|uniref:pleckstrin homology domain-containing family G member 4B-like n=1 Tax=Embiotoca jacksoni TaxID=100190 RepID=UPI003704A98C